MFENYENQQNRQSSDQAIRQETKQDLIRFLKPPNDEDMARQHYAYALQYLKPKQMKTEQFIAYSTIRSAQETQIMILCSGILQRKIITNCYDVNHVFEQQLFLQTVSHLSSYKFEIQNKLKMMRKLLKNCVSKWTYSDTNFCPIFGPFIGILIQQLQDNKLIQQYSNFKKVPYLLALKCWQQFKRIQKQNKQYMQMQVQLDKKLANMKKQDKQQKIIQNLWNQRFIITAALCCFRQIKLTQKDTQQIQFITKLIFQLRNCEIMTQNSTKPKNKRQFEKQRNFSVNKVLFNNIQVISQYMSLNNDKLNLILRQFDEGLSVKIKWNTNNKKIYQLNGQSELKQKYQIDLYRGCIFKNGKQVLLLNQTITKKEKYKTLFGENNYFRVFPSLYPGYVRTKDDVGNKFKIQTFEDKTLNTSIYFQFSQNGEDIRYIVKNPNNKDNKDNKEQIWRLVTLKQMHSQLHIPQIFKQNYFIWFCLQKKCIMFRKKNYSNIYDIGMVIHLKQQTSQEYKIQKSFLVQFQNGFEKQNLDIISNLNSAIYDQIVLRSNKQNLNQLKPYKYLSKIQDVPYIIQIKDKETKYKQTIFFLHRFHLRFRLKNEKMHSESHYGYHIQSSYYKKKQCIFNKFPCLILKKDENDQMILNSHKHILIVSDGKIQEDGNKCKIIKQDGVNKIIDFYKYDIHDFFGDIRGYTRQSQLHMAAIMLSINDNLKVSLIQMTPFQYSMHLMKTCLTNRPFDEKLQKKLLNIIELGSEQILLLCEVLWQASRKLNFLPFHNKFFNTHLSNKMQKLQKLQCLKCRTVYEDKIKKQSIAYREQINNQMLKFIGFNINVIQYHKKQQSDQLSSSQEQSIKYWKNLKQYDGENIKNDFKKIKNMYQKLLQNFKRQSEKMQGRGMQPQIEFPQELKKTKQHLKDSEMMQEMIEKLEKSYKNYKYQQVKINHINNIYSRNSQQRKQQIENLKKLCGELIAEIQKIIEKTIQQNSQHPDVITGFRPTLNKASFTKILCVEEQIYSYFPKMKQSKDKKSDIELSPVKMFKDILKMWMDTKTRLTSLQKLLILIKDPNNIDIISILRQIDSPREQIYQKPSWICFETQMKIQIWQSQYLTYKKQTQKESDYVNYSQLNMGEGKTQVIIPMIILDNIFNKQDKIISRINLLSSLYQESRQNLYRFLSVTGFQIPAFQIPFIRKVQLIQHNILAVRNYISHFERKAYILMSRQSRLSEILKYREHKLKNKQDIKKKQLYQGQSLLNCRIYDIFDQIDAIMTPKKSTIYSIGQRKNLLNAETRLPIIRQILQDFVLRSFKYLVQKKMITFDKQKKDAQETIKNGQFPIGLRFTLQNIPQDYKTQWKKILVTQFLKNSNRHQYSFVQNDKINKQKFDSLVNYCINPGGELLQQEFCKDQIYVLRGVFAYKIFQYCLSKRCGIDYGIPGEEHGKRIAVPYEGADLPSKTSQFEQPQVSSLFTYISYYTKGLSLKQFQQAFKELRKLNQTQMQNQFKRWISICKQKNKDSIIKHSQQINFNSKADLRKLYDIFHKNRITISFWLNKCVFPKDLDRYQQSICSSCFDLADTTTKSIGFSGTMDNHWIMPYKCKPIQNQSLDDGKMIDLMLNHTKQVCPIHQSNSPVWQRFIQISLEKQVGCIIDAGAICVGVSLQNTIVPWIANNKSFQRTKYKGISFCDQEGLWKVFDLETKVSKSRGTTIPDQKTFIIYDQARSRGADIKMNNQTVAALSLSPNITKDKLVQAAGRLRKLGRNQKIILITTNEVLLSLPQFPRQIKDIKQKMKNMQTKKIVQIILSWSIKNTIKQNENLLLQYANLGWKHVYTKQNKLNQPYIKKQQQGLKQKYEKILQIKKIKQFKQQDFNFKSDNSAQQIRQRLNNYGYAIKQKTFLDDICDRQVQTKLVKPDSIIQYVQKQYYNLKPVAQINKQQLLPNIKQMPYKFDDKFKFSKNLILTTKSDVPLQNEDPIKKIQNQLPQLYFVKYNKEQFVLITLRQASNFIRQNILQRPALKSRYDIAILNQVSINTQFIKDYKMKQCYVTSKFLAGCQNFSIEQQQHLIKMLVRSIKQHFKPINMNHSQRNKIYHDYVSQILKMKRLYKNKFVGSTLQKIIINIQNQINYQQNLKRNINQNSYKPISTPVSNIKTPLNQSDIKIQVSQKDLQSRFAKASPQIITIQPK